MPIARKGEQIVWRRRDRRGALMHWLWMLGFALLLLASAHMIAQRTIWDFVLDAPAQAADLLSRMFPPDLDHLDALWRPLWDTINMATLGTLIAILLAVPLAFLAARNTTPRFPLLRPLALLIIVTSRSINSLIWALVLVLILGPGVLAGVVAIALRSVGFIGKLLYEAIEDIDPRPVEAITATGASSGQLRVFAVVPQIMPAFAGITVYRWDINIREATILGLVGAGGLGVELIASVNTLAWGRVATLFLLILGTVLISEWISARLRAAVT